MKILIVDDELNILSTVGSALRRSGYDVLTSSSYEDAVKLIDDSIDIALLDVWLGEHDGIELLSIIKSKFPQIECVMISGHADIGTAVSAVKKGAYDFLEKPLSLDKIEVLLTNIARLKRIENERDDLKQLLGDGVNLVGKSGGIEEVKNLITRIAPEDARVLITGENGTGKELVARLIHEGSSRGNGPFVAVNCAALPDDLIESELFGYEKGAFTGAVKSKPGRFEIAKGGTLFLDEIAETSAKTQAKLLRAVEEGVITRLGGTNEIKTDIRIISATNRNIKEMIKDGSFREDLYFRIAVLLIDIPPLRDRVDDIQLLVKHFSDQFCLRRGRKPREFEKSALKLFMKYQYPGNIRELANYVERVLIMSPDDKITKENIENSVPIFTAEEPTGTLKVACEHFERDYIKRNITKAGGNMTLTAELLGLERSHLYKKIKSLDIKID